MANVVEVILRGKDELTKTFANATKGMEGFKAAAAGVAGIAGAIATAALGALTTLTVASIRNADQMGKAAQKAGMAVEPFSQLAYACELADVSQQSLIAASKALSQEMVKQGRGSEDLLPQLLAQADVFAKMQDGAEKTALAVQLFGKSGQDLIPLLNQGSAAIRATMLEADKLGLTIKKDFAERANAFDDNLTKLKKSLGALGNEVAQFVLPTLIEFSDATVTWSKNGRQMADIADMLSHKFSGYQETLEGALKLTLLWQSLKDPKNWSGVMGMGGLPDLKKVIADAQRLLDMDRESRARGESDGGARPETPSNIDKLFTSPVRPGEGFIGPMLPNGMSIEQFHELADEQIMQEMRLQQRSESGWVTYYSDLARLTRERNEQTLQATGQLFGSLAHLAQTGGKKMFGVWQAFSIAHAIIDTYAGANKALASLPYPANVIAAAAVVAEGLANVATIVSTKPAGQAHSGLDSVPRTGTYILEQGEAVVKRDQNARLAQFLDRQERGSAGGTTHIHLHVANHEIASWLWDGTRDGSIVLHERAITS